MATKIEIDWENSAQAWWGAVQQMGEAEVPADLGRILFGAPQGSSIIVDEARAAELRRWCERIPGWSDGPEYAQTALVFTDVRRVDLAGEPIESGDEGTEDETGHRRSYYVNEQGRLVLDMHGPGGAEGLAERPVPAPVINALGLDPSDWQ